MIKEYLKKHRYDLVVMIVMAAEGDSEPLREALKSDHAAWDLIQAAKQYGEETKAFAVADYPIAVSEDGWLTKKPFRLAGLIISGQKEFLAVKCAMKAEMPVKYNLSKETQKKVDDFFSRLTSDSLETSDTGGLHSPVTAAVELPVNKKGK